MWYLRQSRSALPLELLFDQRCHQQPNDPDQHSVDDQTEQVERPLRGNISMPIEIGRCYYGDRHHRRENRRKADVARLRRASRTVSRMLLFVKILEHLAPPSMTYDCLSIRKGID